MSNRPLARLLGSLAIAGLLFAPSARGELAAWDQAKVTALARELTTATDALYDTFLQQPPPTSPGSVQSEAYQRLRYRVRMLRGEARTLVTLLEEGDGRDQTVFIYEILMSHTRSARYEALEVFVAKEVGDRAAAVRAVLNQLGPYYDPDFRMLPPDSNIEPGATRPAPR
jgi:hypothetical protein